MDIDTHGLATLSLYDLIIPGLEWMECSSHNARLSTKGCARMYRSAQLDRPDRSKSKYACRFCPIGAAHAGVTVAPMAQATEELRRVCPRCLRSGLRMPFGKWCISCYNRNREAKVGKNAKGTRPKLADELHSVRLWVSENGQVTQVESEKARHRLEAMMMTARQAKTPMRFGVPASDQLMACSPAIDGSGYEPTSHACRHCGGRVCQSGDRFRCGSCGVTTGDNPTGICGCGIHLLFDIATVGRFRCVANPDRGPTSQSKVVIEFFSEPGGPSMHARHMTPHSRPTRPLQRD